MNEARVLRGKFARRSGRRGEVRAAAWLMLKSYRILGFRPRSDPAEIDLPGIRRRTLAVVRVKRRTSLAVALDSRTLDQRQRLRRAGESLAAWRPVLSGASVRLDLMALAPGRLPMHIPDAWKGS